MAVTRPTYATREDVKKALDVKQTARNDAQIDQAIEAASDSVEGLLHRVFYPQIDTRYVDWPNFQGSYPWKVYLDAAELADITTVAPVLTSGGNVIPAGDILWGNPRYSPPYTYFELLRNTNASLGQGSTPQRDVGLTALFGHSAKTTPAGVLAAAMSDTTSTAVTVTNSAVLGVGDNFLVDTERLLITDKSMVSTGQTQQGSGVSTANPADVALAVTDGTKYFVGETLLLDSERMLIVDIAGNALTVKRAWDGSVLATHTGATIYALRQLTVVRGALGTTAATHLNAAAVNRHVVPPLVKQLTTGEAEVDLIQQGGGYANSQGSGAAKQTGIGQGLDALRARCLARYGRKARQRTV